MKKLLCVLALLLLSACAGQNRETGNPNERYTYLVEMLEEHETFVQSSSYFDIEVEMAKISQGYRYYITVDNPRVAMYDIQLLGIEKEVDYMTTMAANVGVFEDTQYNMVPNQAYAEKGYVKGLVASGISEKPETTLYVFVQFKNADYSLTHSEFFALDVRYEGD